ncbi:hypothetical protein G647_08746 [Cladophialophora carrionii CBS 160.54]|uniref:Uncharacterized protein n=1 Tax=Cladophialophora carrionii CBS 160.54 TaxID=1279043 RepID=V9D0B5_9EURO|nr:uncharacterized protein G647_08746 [Cladophialophora carrionii CBS 160.54]ETI19733.1 hypothetical protein G647_08746 [Cladophialophora carrionii CBS 160.54]
MQAIVDGEIYALVHELLALRRRDPDPDLHDLLFRDITDELDAIIVVDDMERSLLQDMESEKRVTARIKVLERHRNIRRLREAKEKVELAMEQYMAAVEAQAWEQKAQASGLGVQTRVDEANEALKKRTSEFEELKKMLE